LQPEAVASQRLPRRSANWIEAWLSGWSPPRPGKACPERPESGCSGTRGHILHGHWRPCGQLSRKGEALLRLVLYLFALFSWSQAGSDRNLAAPLGDSTQNLDPDG